MYKKKVIIKPIIVETTAAQIDDRGQTLSCPLVTLNRLMSPKANSILNQGSFSIECDAFPICH